MAVTQNTFTGDGSTVLFSFTFPYLETTDIKVSLDGSVTTAYTLANATTIQFNTAPANGVAIRIYRQTDDSALAATFYPGSAIRSQDLNENFTQNLYVTQESSNSATTASTTANSATTTANTALTNSTTAINTANAATATATTASTNASAAVSTANTASTNASNALSTANTASTNASAAVTTANTAATNAASAVSTANSAASDASTALSTANTALSTANAASSTATTAATNAASAVTTANTANSNAAAALNAVAASVQYQLVANVAAIPGSPADGDAVEVANSTGIESFTPLANIPVGFTGDTGLSVRMQYTSASSTWNWLNYFANDSDTRYLKKSGGTLTGTLTLNADPTQNLEAATKQYVDNVANSGGLPLTGGTMTGQILGDNSTSATTPGYAFDGDANTGLYTTGADELALSTGGTARLTIDSAGAVAIPGTASVGGQAVVVDNDARLTDTRTPTDGSVTDAKVAAAAAIAGTKISPDFGSQNITTTGTVTVGAITIPNTDGTNGQVLTTNGSGTLSFTTVAAGGGASVTTSDTAPTSPSDGDLWYDSVGGRLYVYYDDGNTSQWVDAAPQGGGGGASVTVSETAPTSPTAGDLWFDNTTTDARLYIYYDDGNTQQWIDAAPAGAGAGGGAGGKILQVVRSHIGGKASTTSTSLTKLATSASITPSSTGSKILVAISTGIGNADTGNANFSIVRTVGGVDTTVFSNVANKQGASGGYLYDAFSWIDLDSPSTTSAVTYSLSALRIDGNATPFAGGRNTDSAYAMGVMFILSEVSA